MSVRHNGAGAVGPWARPAEETVMAAGDTVWGIDVGQCALKALKLRAVEGALQVEAFDIIEHPKMLSQPGADRDQLIANALEQFLARNNLAGAKVAIAAPGQSGFTRFVKLPPVDAKQVPEIVRFEAEQQIPFDIDEVIWRWEDFKDPDSPDVEVGIFAMKRSDVTDALGQLAEAGITVDVVQMAPLCLYNFMTFDGQTVDDGATLLVDVGADKTELVVSDGPRVWTRTIQLGGNNFTAALVKAFKLSFSKAEKFKRSAATSKYAPQIFKAMQPVFAELVQEISRSIGYYTSLHRDSRFRRVIGLGNGFRLPGLQTFLERNLNIPVIRLDSYNELPPSAVVNAPAFTENVLSFAVAYGLALQGLGLTKIQTSLLPTKIARQRLWKRKVPWFAASAAAAIAVLGLGAYTARSQARDYRPGGSLDEVKRVVQDHSDRVNKFNKTEGVADQVEDEIKAYGRMLDYRGVWPEIHTIICDAIGGLATHQTQMNAVDLDKLTKVARGRRRTFEIDALTAQYRANVTDIDAEKLGEVGGGAMPGPGRFGGPDMFGRGPMGARRSAPDDGGGMDASAASGEAAEDPSGPARPGYIVTLEGRTPVVVNVWVFINSLKNRVIEATGLKEVSIQTGALVELELGEKVTPAADVPGVPGGAWDAPGMPGGRRMRAPGGRGVNNTAKIDPLTGEDTTEDSRFVIKWVFVIEDPNPVAPADPAMGGAVR